MNAGDEFASVILVKHNLVEVLTRELDRPGWARERVALGTATDPYQPIEGHYRLTRGAIEALVRARTPIGLVTKGPMVVRDIDVLKDAAREGGCTVYVSVPTVDEDAWRALEPGTAPPEQRLRAVRALVDAGIDAGVLMAPLVPGFSTSRAKVERTMRAIADCGARFVGYNVMYLEEGTREHFMAFLAERFPSLRPRLDRLYGRKHAPAAYRSQVQGMVRMLQARYGLAGRRPVDTAALPPATSAPELEQAAFAW
jgi:DNA repair photolyase